jgi:hypothetical protein
MWRRVKIILILNILGLIAIKVDKYCLHMQILGSKSWLQVTTPINQTYLPCNLPLLPGKVNKQLQRAPIVNLLVIFIIHYYCAYIAKYLAGMKSRINQGAGFQSR